MSEPIVYISNRQPIMASRCLELSAKGKTPPSAAPLILAGDPTHSFTVVYLCTQCGCVVGVSPLIST